MGQLECIPLSQFADRGRWWDGTDEGPVSKPVASLLKPSSRDRGTPA
jgi:hypothetical protein